MENVGGHLDITSRAVPSLYYLGTACDVFWNSPRQARGTCTNNLGSTYLNVPGYALGVSVDEGGTTNRIIWGDTKLHRYVLQLKF